MLRRGRAPTIVLSEALDLLSSSTAHTKADFLIEYTEKSKTDEQTHGPGIRVQTTNKVSTLRMAFKPTILGLFIAFTTGNPFRLTKSLGFSTGRGSGL